MAKRPSLIVELATLRRAALALYQAGHWELDRPMTGQKQLWEALRDALGLPPGSAPPPIGAASVRAPRA